MQMNEASAHDWRVTEGPAIGREPEFELAELRLHSQFNVTGTLTQSVTALLSTSSPAVVESLGCSLSELRGFIRIYDHLPDEAYSHLFGGPYDSFKLGSNRGVLAMVPLERFTRAPPESFLIHLYLPPDQFAVLVPMVACARANPQLYIEIERTLEQNVFEEDVHFWNDRLSPLILFNEFRLDVPIYRGCALPANSLAPSPG